MAPPAVKKEKSRKQSSQADPWIGSRLVEGLRESIFMEYLTAKDVALVMFYDPKEGMCEWSKKHFLKVSVWFRLNRWLAMATYTVNGRV